MPVSTNRDATADRWQLNDDVIRFRRWARDENYAFPTDSRHELVIGSGDASWLRLEDDKGLVSRKHATLSLSCSGNTWTLRDAGSTNGVVVDGIKCAEVTLEPGMKVRLGGVTLVAETKRLIVVRAFVARMLGWSAQQLQDVDLALQYIRTASKHHAALVLCCPDKELTQLAYALHQRELGPDRPFVVCDPRRRRVDKNVRAAENYQSGMEALQAARHGSICIWSSHPPPDIEQMRAAAATPDMGVQLIVCGTRPSEAAAWGTMLIDIPALSARKRDLSRIVEEYADDIAAGLGVDRASFSLADQAWVVEHGSHSLPEIEKVVLRIFRLRQVGGDRTAAADLLGQSRQSLERWIDSRYPPVPPAPVKRSR